jgi:hypothetical protein
MPKPLILIASCELWRLNGYNETARQTWLRSWPDGYDYRFTLGRGCQNPAPDELILDAPDDYLGLSYKVRESRRWATANGYGYTFHCGSDTYVIPPRLLASGYEKHDYSGYLIHDEHRLYAPRNIQMAQGGGGYWLSPRAGNVVAVAPIYDWMLKAEDVFVADGLFNAGIAFGHDAGYWSWGYRSESDPPTLEGGEFIGMDAAITVHLSRWWGEPKYSMAWMADTHARMLTLAEGPLNVLASWRRLHLPPPPPDVP